MSRKLSIVAYHYVRDLKNSRFPAIKGLAIRAFREQIRYIKKYYHVISGPELLDIIETDSELTIGQTVVDWWGVTGSEPNVMVMSDVDRQGFIDLVVERISRL